MFGIKLHKILFGYGLKTIRLSQAVSVSLLEQKTGI